MWKCASHIEAVEMDHEWVILDGERYMVTKLNEVGGWLWSKLREGTTLERLVLLMTEQYDIEPKQARADIVQFVEHLIECGLVEHVA